jgi:hypothetical protein
MEVTGYASDKDCRSPADNDKNQIKSELLFPREPDLAAAHTTVAFPLIFSTETARRSCRNLDFFLKKRPRVSAASREDGSALSRNELFFLPDLTLQRFNVLTLRRITRRQPAHF